MTSLADYRRNFSPLLAGIAISSPEIKKYGTLGCLATNGLDQPYGITAAHVVTAGIRDTGLPVHQAHYRNDPRISDDSLPCLLCPPLDIIAFPISPGQIFLPEMYHLGNWNGVSIPIPGTRVRKVGVATGLTSALIGDVFEHEFDVLPLLPRSTAVRPFAAGDSGAAWITEDSRALVGIHYGAMVDGTGKACRLDTFFAAVGLRAMEYRPT